MACLGGAALSALDKFPALEERALALDFFVAEPRKPSEELLSSLMLYRGRAFDASRSTSFLRTFPPSPRDSAAT